jgi:hypothetical protein
MLMKDLDPADQIAIGYYSENRNRVPPEELEKYRGQFLAWSLDGTRILAHSEDPEALPALLLQAGEDPHRYVEECIPEEDTLFPWSALIMTPKPRRANEADSR